jgi:3-oxosteroid 1-dehydrogenase
LDQEYDVVVIGSGIGGMAAALTASEHGLRTVVFEKAKKLGGGTAASHGGFWLGGTHIQKAAGYNDNLDNVITYMRFLSGSETDEARMLTFVKRGPEALEFFDRCGVKFRVTRGMTDHYYDMVPGSVGEGRLFEVELISANELGDWKDAVLIWPQAPLEMTIEEKIFWGGPNDPNNWKKDLMEQRRRDRICGRGPGAIMHFLKQALRRGATIRPGLAVDRLICENGSVTGVVTADGTVVTASKGVVLATGGYEANADLVQTFEGLPGWLSMFPSSLTGDGLKMASEIGAACKIIHNNIALFLGYNVPPANPGDEPAFRLCSIGEMLCPHTMVVNRDGRRFEDESYFPSMVPALRHFVTSSHQFANLPCFLIFDSQFHKKFTFADRPLGRSIPEWVARGRTLAELANELGIDPTNLLATAERFNDFARKGSDDDFGRGRKKWSTGAPLPGKEVKNASLGTIEVSPFYGLQLHPSAFASAGLLADIHARVIHQRGHAIPGLYAVGNAAAHTEYGVGYQAGHSLASGMTFGYLAVLHMLNGAAVEPPLQATASRPESSSAARDEV